MPLIDLGGNDYPSYADTAEADIALAADILRAGTWATRSDDTKKRALVSATRMMLYMPWCDPAPDPSAAGPLDATLIYVTSALAEDLAAKPRLVRGGSANSNVKNVKAGSAQVEFFGPVAGAPPIARELWDQLVAAELLCLGTGDVDPWAGAIVTGICGEVRPYEGRYSTEYWIAAMDYD